MRPVDHRMLETREPQQHGDLPWSRAAESLGRLCGGPSSRRAVVMAVAAVLLSTASLAQQPEPLPAPEPSSATVAAPTSVTALDSREGVAETETQTETETEAQIQERLDRVGFELPVPDDQGGGIIVGQADLLESSGDGVSVLSGEVKIVYQDLEIRADRIEYDAAAGRVVATGAVIFDQGPQRLAGDSLEYNLDTKLGRFTNTSGYLSSDYFFSGALVEKIGDDRYLVEDGVFTSCEGEDPSWSFRAERIRITVDKYAKVRNARFRAGKVPVLYMPYMMWPVKQARTSGFLVAKPGYSSRRGLQLSLGYFQALGRSYDATFSADIYGGGSAGSNAQGGGEFLGFGQEFRYRPSEGTQGIFQGYAIRDPERDSTRWKMNLFHESNDLPWGFRGLVKFEDVSDFDYFRDYERSGDLNSQRQIYSQGFLTRNRGSHSFNLKFDSRETLVGTNADGTNRFVTLRQLPEFEYKLRSTSLGPTPLYLQLQSSAHLIEVDRSERQNDSYGRLDLLPTLTLPVRVAPWLSLALNGGVRYTWYSDSLYLGSETVGTTSDFRGESLTRVAPFASAEIIGPSVSRIYESESAKTSKLKHIIEPRVTYSFGDTFDDLARIPSFDEVDRNQAGNTTRYSLVNRLLAKPRDESRGGAREILSLTLFQDYSFDLDQPLQSSADRQTTSASGPLSLLFLYNPSLQTNLRVDADYDTLFGGLSSSAISGRVAFRERDHLGLRWTTRRSVERDQTTSHQVRLSSAIGIGQRWTVSGEVNYDVERSVTQLQRYFLDFKGKCFGLTFEFGDYETGLRKDQQVRFLLTLKNVGTFLDINGGQSEEL